MTAVTKSQQDTKLRPQVLTDVFQVQIAKRQRYLFVKRVLDLAICIVALPEILFLIAIIAIAIALDSPGSPFFTQERIGKDGRRFRMYKFRTLKHDYDNPEHRLFMQAFVLGQKIFIADNPGNASNKPPINSYLTRVGAILRKTSLDELLQILNVLKGEMSLIGPRPNVSWEVEKYQDWHCARMNVLPGITGLAQVNGRSDITFDEIVRYDIEYVHDVCLKLDLQILWETIKVVLSRDGAG